MALTGEALSGIADKTIVLVGALAPARFSETDAPFNLGMAFADRAGRVTRCLHHDERVGVSGSGAVKDRKHGFVRKPWTERKKMSDAAIYNGPVFRKWPAASSWAWRTI